MPATWYGVRGIFPWYEIRSDTSDDFRRHSVMVGHIDVKASNSPKYAPISVPAASGIDSTQMCENIDTAVDGRPDFKSVGRQCTITIKYAYQGDRWGVMPAAGQKKGGWCYGYIQRLVHICNYALRCHNSCYQH